MHSQLWDINDFDHRMKAFKGTYSEYRAFLISRTGT
jgi:hypothetical protein